MISPLAVIHKNVKLGKNVIVEEFCIIGAPSKGVDASTIETIIGDNAHIRSHTVIYAGTVIGENFQSGNKANVRENCRIGDNVSIGTSAVIEHQVKIEDGVRVHSQAFVPEFTRLCESCWVGPNVVLTNARYPKSIGVKENLKGPTVGRFAKVGANATVLPGLVIGDNSLIGAGSVVVKDVESNTVVVGNPAKKIKSIDLLPYEVQ